IAQPALDGPGGCAQHLRGLFHGEAVIKDQFQDLAMLGRELAEGGGELQASDDGILERGLLRPGCFLIAVRRDVVRPASLDAPARVTQRIEGAVARDAKQPGRDARLMAEVACLAPDGQKYVLEQLVDKLSIAADLLPDIAPERRAIARVQ